MIHHFKLIILVSQEGQQVAFHYILFVYFQPKIR